MALASPGPHRDRTGVWPVSTVGRRDADARRARDKPWRKWYASARWRGPAGRRTQQLHRVPYCQPCKVMGFARRATVANHVTPHRGDPWLFWYGALESVCKNCHDEAIQRAELEGFRRDVDEDGWPVDDNHPFNRPRKHRPHDQAQGSSPAAPDPASPALCQGVPIRDDGVEDSR